MKEKKARFLNWTGVVIMLALIVVCIPFTVPKLFGLQLYEVKTESMEPAYPVGSVLYVRPAEVSEVSIGDAITYTLGSDTELVMTHRVVDISEEEQNFITKGDANAVEDAEPVSFSRLIGKPVCCISGMASVYHFIDSGTGKKVIVALFLMVLVIWQAADRTKKKQEQKQEEKREKKKISSSTFFLAAGIGLIAIALLMLIPALIDRKKSNDTYEALAEEYVKMDEAVAVEGEDTDWWYEEVDIDLDELAKINPDIVGWIRFDTIDIINYPLLYSGDDETYLRSDIYGNKTTAGCIFIEGANNPDMSDYHTIIYGHNMKNQSMFGSLKNYKKEDFYEEHQYFTIYTKNMAYRYQIFAYRDVPETHEVYTIGFSPDENYQNFINEIVRHSYQDTDIEVTKNDYIVTLSTCSTEGNRFVVHAVRVDEHEYNLHQ